jgi:mono/diheme cytochrome c family protein
MPPLVGESMYGPDLFDLYCATCHGRDGKGAGPVAQSLKTPPSDLTLLARRNGGLFPRGRVKAAIAGGTATPSHGSVDMPVWGPIFRGLDPSDARVEVRINNLVSHVASIQQK